MELFQAIVLVAFFCATAADSRKNITWTSSQSYVYNTTDSQGRQFPTKCIKELGCFYTGYPWYDPPMRVSSPVPEDVENIKYYLYTPLNPHNAYLLNVTRKSILYSPFNAEWPTFIPVHAYWADENSIRRELKKKDAVLSVANYNVIVPDFRDYVLIPYYKAVTNIRVVAARIAQLLRKLVEVTGIKPESIHLVGFSLGAHTCAYVGKIFPNLGRITALSPAGRNFMGTSEETHLVPSDALFVDVIHSSGDGEYGFQILDARQHNGHQNFYVNNAKRQPGCSWLGDTFFLMNFLKDFPETYCDHLRSNHLFQESITSKHCTFKAVRCGSYDEFASGNCTADNSPVVVMGFQAAPVPGIGPEDSLYIDTGDLEPYCAKDNTVPRALRTKVSRTVEKEFEFYQNSSAQMWKNSDSNTIVKED